MQQIHIRVLAALAIAGAGASGCAQLGATNPATLAGPPAALAYTANPAKFVYGSAITPDELHYAGATATSISIDGVLPDGLTFDPATGTISGTPTTMTPQKTYTIRVVNGFGTNYIYLPVEITDHPPTLSYAGVKTLTYTVGDAVSITPTLGGGATSSCTSTPALPAGLSLSSSCVISGSVSEPSAAQDYVISANNSGGSGTLTFNFTVNDNPPVITYSGSPFTYSRGIAISPLSPSSTGGAVVSCASSPSLPAGLLLGSDCKITGTPSAVSGAASYTITATNSGGSATVAISIQVTETKPVISYTGSPFSLPKGKVITPIAASNSGGTIDTCTVSPPLPSGLAISGTSCEISGTPSVVSGATIYTITAGNAAGSNTAQITLAVNDAAPVISYTGSPYTFSNQTAITTVTPNRSGGTITSCTSSPSLPSGLLLSNTTCAISGTPTAASAATQYTITASNSGGSSSATISITVQETAPNLSFAGPYTFTQGVAITPVSPTNSGGAVSSCTASPALPSGLLLASDCTISGTPSATSSTASYSIKGTNSVGSSTQVISITVNAGPTITYTGSPYQFTVNTAITTVTPTHTGGSITGCTVSPSLPTGLAISNTTCAISGTPSAITPSADYTVTATSTDGTSTAIINIAIVDQAPAINYDPTSYNFTYQVGTAITPLIPNNTGGTITSCAASPSLPAGLTLSQSDCTMSGTPSAVRASQTYTITASNSGGSSAQIITITVNDLPPTLSYAGSPYIYSQGTAIATLTPTDTGGAITSCSASPGLPSGLSLSSQCVISGTPSVVSAATDYTITASNSGGSASTIINITVNAVPPNLSFSPSSASFQVRIAGTPVAPANSGGAPDSCTISPSLPSGLAISSACVISGTPTVVAAATLYTVTGTNSGGSSSATITVTVKNQPQIVYSSLTAVAGGWNGTPAGSKNIWVASVDAVDHLALTQNTNTLLDSILPSFSPDGKHVVYGSLRAQNGSTNGASSSSYDVWTEAVDGTGSTALTTNSNSGLDSDKMVSYSPDGTKVTFATKASTSSTQNGSKSQSYNVWVMNNDGSGRVYITSNTSLAGLDSINPVFSPDGTKVYFASLMSSNGGVTANPSYNIWVANIDGTGLTNLTGETLLAGHDCTEPQVSPDGTKVVYTSLQKVGGVSSSSTNIFQMNADGTGAVPLTTNTAAGLDSKNAHYSPDGSEIVFASKMAVGGVSSSSFNIWKMGATGASQVSLTTNTASGKDSITPQFTSDNLQILFASRQDVSGVASSSYNIWIMSADGTGTPTAVTQNTAAGLDSTLSAARAYFAP